MGGATVWPMTEQVTELRNEAWERLLVAIRDAAATADPGEVKALAEAFELLTRRV